VRGVIGLQGRTNNKLLGKMQKVSHKEEHQVQEKMTEKKEKVKKQIEMTDRGRERSGLIKGKP